jgi:hypothetical protein
MYIIITIICLLLFTYFADISYCDYISLEELKANILAESEKYYKALDEYKDSDDLLRQAKLRPEKNEDIIRFLTGKTNDKYSVYNNHLSYILSISNNIRKIDPYYMFTIKKYYLSEIHH